MDIVLFPFVLLLLYLGWRLYTRPRPIRPPDPPKGPVNVYGGGTKEQWDRLQVGFALRQREYETLLRSGSHSSNTRFDGNRDDHS